MPSVSKSQQRLMGVAYAVKSGSMELKDVDAEYRDKVASLVDGMTKKDLKKYASTKHDKLPETVDETFQQTMITPNQIGGMGDVKLPSAGELGSGDIPHTIVQVADIDDEEEAKKQKGTVKNLQAEELALTFKAFLNEQNEAIDYNDPVLIRLRQADLRRKDMAKLDAIKKEAEKNRKKAMKRWNQKKYDQWLEDVASNGGAENAFDMAQNAEFEPGLIDWVKKEFPYDDALQRIQWDIEAYAESVVTEGKLQDQVEELVRGLDTDEYEVFAFDNDIDPEDANQMTDFIMQLSNKDAKAIIKQLSESVVTEGFSNLKISGPAYDLWNDREVQRKLRGVKIRIVGDIDGVLTVRGHDDELQKVKDIDLCCIESVVNEKKLDREDMMAWIEKSMDFVSTTEEFNGSQGGIWVSGEAGDEYKGRVIYDYYSEDYKNRTFGVDNRWEKELNKRGWYSEWHDAGTSMIWPL